MAGAGRMDGNMKDLATKSGIKKLLSQKKTAVLAGIAALGIIFLVFAEYIPKGTVKTDTAFDETAYAENLERELEEIIGRIDGIDDVKVMVTLAGSPSYRYARDQSVMASGDTDSVFRYAAGDAAKSEPLLTAVTAPEIKGVSVVCKGAANQVLRKKVIELIAGTLDLNTNRIYVTE